MAGGAPLTNRASGASWSAAPTRSAPLLLPPSVACGAAAAPPAGAPGAAAGALALSATRAAMRSAHEPASPSQMPHASSRPDAQQKPPPSSTPVQHAPALSSLYHTLLTYPQLDVASRRKARHTAPEFCKPLVGPRCRAPLLKLLTSPCPANQTRSYAPACRQRAVGRGLHKAVRTQARTGDVDDCGAAPAHAAHIQPAALAAVPVCVQRRPRPAAHAIPARGAAAPMLSRAASSPAGCCQVRKEARHGFDQIARDAA